MVIFRVCFREMFMSEFKPKAAAFNLVNNWHFKFTFSLYQSMPTSTNNSLKPKLGGKITCYGKSMQLVQV